MGVSPPSSVRLFASARTWSRARRTAPSRHPAGGASRSRRMDRTPRSPPRWRVTSEEELRHVRTLPLPCFASSVCAGGEALVVGTSTGASVYDLRAALARDLPLLKRRGEVDGGDDSEDAGRALPRPVELMKAHGVHAMSASYPYLAAVSGDKIGVWRLDRLLRGMRGRPTKAKSKSKGGTAAAKQSFPDASSPSMASPTSSPPPPPPAAPTAPTTEEPPDELLVGDNGTEDSDELASARPLRGSAPPPALP
mmetsp:Transcript_25437/g.74899  ORF Transcript_25437/g.74899 Transcript_25437/m.74899 type:complete len:252 (-) Transcript_25437:713-1468(-)